MKVNEHWTEYTLVSDTGLQVSFLNYGGIITEMIAPDQDHNFENIVLSYQNYQDYEDNPNYFGAIIGRVAGRMSQANFSLNGKSYPIEKNEGDHHLHGGSSGLHQVMWQVKPFESSDRVGATLFYRSPHGDGGYPGNVDITVTYTLTNDNQFTIDYNATTDRPTILSLTNHTYFNLTGNLKKPINEHHVQMQADHYLEMDQHFIATGKHTPVAGTPFDFRKGRQLQTGMTSDDPQNILVNHGYDHYFLLSDGNNPQAIITEPTSGRTLTVHTNQPGIVLYTANQLQKSLVLKERLSEQYLGLCLETQGHAASLEDNNLPSIVIDKNNSYKKQTTFLLSQLE